MHPDYVVNHYPACVRLVGHQQPNQPHRFWSFERHRQRIRSRRNLPVHLQLEHQSGANHGQHHQLACGHLSLHHHRRQRLHEQPNCRAHPAHGTCRGNHGNHPCCLLRGSHRQHVGVGNRGRNPLHLQLEHHPGANHAHGYRTDRRYLHLHNHRRKRQHPDRPNHHRRTCHIACADHQQERRLVFRRDHRLGFGRCHGGHRSLHLFVEHHARTNRFCRHQLGCG